MLVAALSFITYWYAFLEVTENSTPYSPFAQLWPCCLRLSPIKNYRVTSFNLVDRILRKHIVTSLSQVNTACANTTVPNVILAFEHVTAATKRVHRLGNQSWRDGACTEPQGKCMSHQYVTHLSCCYHVISW